MGIFDLAADALSGDWGGLLGDVFGTGFDSVSQPTQLVSYNPYLNQVGYQQPMAQPVMAAAPAIATAATGVARWAMRFPNLWQYIQKLYANTRVRMSPEKLLGLLNKYGPAAMTTMVGAQVVSELMMYKATHKRRRMNVANTHALRRSLRRLRGFDHLAGRVKSQLAHSCHTRRSRKH